jgi:hypothetical protein
MAIGHWPLAMGARLKKATEYNDVSKANPVRPWSGPS